MSASNCVGLLSEQYILISHLPLSLLFFSHFSPFLSLSYSEYALFTYKNKIFYSLAYLFDGLWTGSDARHDSIPVLVSYLKESVRQPVS